MKCYLLSAREARNLAKSPLFQLMHQIKECAYNGGFEITLDYKLDKDIINFLNDYGYKIEYESVPIYDDTPYGVRYNIIGYKDNTIISWNENRNFTNTTL